MIAVVTLLTQPKAYCLRELLKSWSALQAPEGEQLRFVIVRAGALDRAERRLLTEFAAAHPTEIHTGRRITRHADHAWWRSLIAGELRERARAALAGGTDEWVFWNDCDVLNPPETIVRLLAHGRALASGLVLNRIAGTPLSGAPITGLTRWDPQGEPGPGLPLTPQPCEVGWVGFGSFLTRGDLVRGISYEPYLSGDVPVWTGEDGYWCMEAARISGEAVLLDTELCPWHVAENGIALAAEWEGELLGRRLRAVGKHGPTEPMLVPRINGISYRFGQLTAGEPLCRDAAGQLLSPAEMRELADASEFLDLVEPLAD